MITPTRIVYAGIVLAWLAFIVATCPYSIFPEDPPVDPATLAGCDRSLPPPGYTIQVSGWSGSSEYRYVDPDGKPFPYTKDTYQGAVDDAWFSVEYDWERYAHDEWLDLTPVPVVENTP